MDNKVWGIDFDSTINDMNQHICTTLKKYYNDATTIDDITSWNFWDDHDLGDIVWGDRMYHCPKWTAAIPPRKDAIRIIHNLLERGDKVVVISDRFQTEFDKVRKWLDFAGLSRVPLALTNKETSKVAIAEEVGCTAVIDDSPHWIDMYTRSKNIRDIYVMSYAYNMDVPRDGRIKRFDTWKQIEKMEFMNERVA